MNRLTMTRLTAAIAAWALTVPAALAQGFPAKPIRLITLTTAGGSLDTLARLVAGKLTEQLGQTVVVENRTGAGGNVGAEAVAKSAPDGYTIGMNTVSTHGINPSLYGASMPFDAVKDFAPITLLAELKNVTVVTAGLPVRNIKELIDYARANPDRLSFGSAGSGTSQHLSGELFKMKTGTRMQHIPYKGAAQAIPDLLSGQIQLMFVSVPEALPHIKSGKLRAIGVTSRQRSSVLPDVPSVAEQGVDFDVSAWFGMVAPAGTPRPIINRYNAEIVKAMQQTDTRGRLAGIGMDPVTMSPDEFAQFIRDEIARWTPVVKASGAKVD
jgi:tripartite-type tricarboxylate transporter receptor subunit TctC